MNLLSKGVARGAGGQVPQGARGEGAPKGRRKALFRALGGASPRGKGRRKAVFKLAPGKGEGATSKLRSVEACQVREGATCHAQHRRPARSGRRNANNEVAMAPGGKCSSSNRETLNALARRRAALQTRGSHRLVSHGNGRQISGSIYPKPV